MKVLVLDDEQEVRDAVKSMLEKHRYEVHCAGTAQDALHMTAAQEYDFVLVDYKLPDNDGVWFMEQARLKAKTKALLITAFVNREVINRMFSLGACGYVIKPFDADELLRHLTYHGGHAISPPPATPS